MCLYSKTGEFKVAEKDITCYKIVCKSRLFDFDKDGYGELSWEPSRIKRFFKKLRKEKYFTPYQEKLIEKSVIKGETNFVAIGYEYIEEPRFNWNNTYMIGEGFVHTFSNFEHAIKALNEPMFNSTNEKKFELYQCVIPKGTKYISGNDCDGRDGYASKEIRFVEKLVDF